MSGSMALALHFVACVGQGFRFGRKRTGRFGIGQTSGETSPPIPSASAAIALVVNDALAVQFSLASRVERTQFALCVFVVENFKVGHRVRIIRAGRIGVSLHRLCPRVLVGTQCADRESIGYPFHDVNVYLAS